MLQLVPPVPEINIAIFPPAGLLQPLPTPDKPWSLIGLKFVTGLLPSKGNTTILTVFKDCFQHPLEKLPMAFETTQLLVNHIFHIYDIQTKVHH